MKMRKIAMGLAEPDLTPMIDMVFLLLTFLIIALNFENIKADERAKLPKDALAKPPTVKPEHEFVLNFRYRRDASGVPVKRVPEIFYNEQFVEVRQISPALEQEKRVMERIHGKDVIKDVTVLIRADAEIPSGLVQELVKKCQESGFSKFLYRTTAEEI